MIGVLLSFCLMGGSGSQVFHVSPVGSDAGNGTAKHPFHSLERARDAAREFRRTHPTFNAPVRIELSKGVYTLDHAFQLTPSDSGSLSSPTEIIGNGATLSGGQVLTGFQVDSHGWWTVHIPDVQAGKWNFSQLFVNGERRYRPRFPRQGYSQINAEVPPSQAAKGHGYDRFGFRPGDLDKTWHNLSDIELLCFHTWDMSRMRIGAIDDQNRVVTTTGPTGYDAGWANFPLGNRYIAENVRETLGQAGDWYLDRPTGNLTYVPMPGESLEHAVIVAPRVERIIEINGDVKVHHPVSNVSLKGIAFAYSNWNVPRQGRFYPQAEVDLSAAIHAEGWVNSELKGCSISHVGEYGIELGVGCHNVTVSNCRLTDLGAGGVKIGEMQLHDNEEDCAHDIQVTDCVITHGGRMHPAAIGVWIGQSWKDKVTYNEIADLYYTGISIGWTWGYSKSQAHHDIIAYNHIHDIGQGVLSDMGGIYTLGIEPGTQLIGNRIHDVDSFSYGGWGIYPDEGSSHEVIEHNIVYRTKSGGYHQHYGQENEVRNNIFAFAREAEIIRTRAEDHLSFIFENNIVFWKNAPLLGSNWSGSGYKLDHNLYWRTDGKPVDFAGMSLSQWQARGNDLHSSIQDPKFKDPEKGDFRLRSGSPVPGIGIDIDATHAVGPRRIKLNDHQVPPAFPVIHTQ